MTNPIRISTTMQEDGELHLSNLPFRRGQTLELVIDIDMVSQLSPTWTAQQLLESSLVGLWADRIDLVESVSYARSLREQAQHRSRD